MRLRLNCRPCCQRSASTSARPGGTRYSATDWSRSAARA